MSTLYREVPITSVEQAAALPEGTFAVRWYVPWIGELIAAEGEGNWQSKNGIYTHAEMIGDIALVPIEGEESVITEQQLDGHITTFHRLTATWAANGGAQ